MPFRWQSAVDWIVLSGALYVLLRWASRARALRLALTVTALYVGSLLASAANLIITSWILQAAALIILALIVILFQPEIRRALMQIDSRVLNWTRAAAGTQVLFDSIANAAFRFAKQRVGALIVIVRTDSVDELIEDGVRIDSDVTAPLLEALFQKYSPLHDGAAVIVQGRISRANTVLPLTQRVEVPRQYGTRHRAAMGLAERSDALVIVVSEERGEVTLMRGRERLLMESPGDLSSALSSAVPSSRKSIRSRFRDAAVANWKLKIAAVGLATLVLGASVLLPGNILRTVRIPVEFTNLPRGLDLADQSATVVEAQLRGRTWIMDSEDLSRLTARFDLTGAHEGVRTIRVLDSSLDLPPGVAMKAVKPEVISVRIVRRKG